MPNVPPEVPPNDAFDYEHNPTQRIFRMAKYQHDSVGDIGVWEQRWGTGPVLRCLRRLLGCSLLLLVML
jgi:hypothetical protein